MAANPIRIVPLRTEALAAVGAPELTYRGGPLLTSVQVFVMFWGPSELVDRINGFFDYVLTSPLIDQLAEYSVPNAAIGYGSRIGTTVLTTAPPATVTDSDVQQMIQRELTSDPAVPQPTANTLYFVFLPSGVTVGMNGESSCVNFCGYHNATQNQIFYAVMPYPDCGGCMGNVSTFDALTSAASHELCEAITDPVAGQSWYDDSNGEIGDICAWSTKRLGRYLVQLEWSNSRQSCI